MDYLLKQIEEWKFIAMNVSNNVTNCSSVNNTLEIELQTCQQVTESLKTDTENCQQLSENLNESLSNLTDEYQTLKKTYDIYRTYENLLIPDAFIIVLHISKTESGRQADFCVGSSTNYGFITESSCCLADEISILTLEENNISIENSSIWIGNDLCFINTTEKNQFDFPVYDLNKTLECNILAFDENEYEFRQLELEIGHNDCFDGSCLSHVNSTKFQNMTFLNGISIMCPQSMDFGIIKKCKFPRFYIDLTVAFVSISIIASKNGKPHFQIAYREILT